MKTRLIDQLAAYGSDEREHRDEASVAAVLSRVDTVRPLSSPEHSGPSGAWPIALAVAVAVVLVVALPLLLSNRGGSAPPATLPNVVPTTAAQELPPSPETIDTLDEWLELPEDVGGLVTGTYRTSNLLAAFSFTVPDRWEKLLDQPTEVALQSRFTDGNSQIWFVVSREESVEAVVARWEEAAGYMEDKRIRTVPPVDVALGGAQGQTLQMRQTLWSEIVQTVGCCPEADVHTFDDLGLPDLHAATAGRGHLLFGRPNLVHVVSVGGATVLVWVDGDDASFLADSQEILDSIIWRDLLG